MKLDVHNSQRRKALPLRVWHGMACLLLLQLLLQLQKCYKLRGSSEKWLFGFDSPALTTPQVVDTSDYAGW